MSTAEASAPTAPYPLHRRVLDTFAAPSRLFEHFRDRTPWIGPLLVAMAVGLIVVMVIPQEFFVEQAREQVRQAGDAGAQMPDPETLAGFARVAGAAGVLVGTPLMAFAAAGVLALLFSVLGGGEVRYPQYLAVMTHAMLITSLGALITLPVQLMRGDLAARLSLALLAPFLEPDSFADRVLQGLEIFTLWAIAVVALGVGILNRRQSWVGAAAVLLGIYALLLAGFAAIAA
jgi:hypothetical protein